MPLMIDSWKQHQDDQAKFGQSFASIETISIAKPYEISEKTHLMENVRDIPVLDFFTELAGGLAVDYADDYREQLKLFRSKEIDLIFCDLINTACHEAAHTLNIPFIITSSGMSGEGTTAPYINNSPISMDNPTTEDESLSERLYNTWVKPIHFLIKARQFLYQQHENLKSLGIKPVFPGELRYKNCIKMFNSAWGFEFGRPLGPLIELVGPIVPEKAAAKLSTDLDQFLSIHKKVAYVAFGQIVRATKADITLILTGLIESYEAKELDGIIWATRGIDKRLFPETIASRSNITYQVHSFFDNGQAGDIKFVTWAAQLAILSHPSTKVFVTHGGTGSIQEAYFSGVRLVVFPFFVDQIPNAVTVKKFGTGVRLDYRSTQEEANVLIRDVVVDDFGHFQKNVNKFRALTQIKSQHGPKRGADIAEEVLFTHENGLLNHRMDAKLRMSWIKAHNLDMHAVVTGILITVLSSVLYLAIGLAKWITKSIRPRTKVKSS
ncbi:hypothetical protein [Parasitella parasitica]|uniref:UDP-glycosyltransferases domain-containing protein n=1 Tax=Parasitella parasitica TaxID=35722 RepID=A0A0B7NK40_9FUNG|nr:hypothetical protein [Parasitella parasitica]